jgi:hypothetical protein
MADAKMQPFCGHNEYFLPKLPIIQEIFVFLQKLIE